MIPADILDSKHVLLDLRAHGKKQVVSQLANHAARAIQVEPEIIRDALVQREELGSTGMGGGIAIPHARLEAVRAPFGLLVRLKPAVHFDAIDDEPVDLIFLLLLPLSSNGENLNALTCAARRLRDPAIAKALRQAESVTELYDGFVRR